VHTAVGRDDAVVIRIALLDDHPAVLAGLQRLVEAEPDLSLLAAAETEEALLQRLEHARPGVIVSDYDLARGDGLAVCQRLKESPRPPAVVIYSAYAGPALALAANMAGADAVVDKGAPVGELLATIRATRNGPIAMPDVPCELRRAAMARLDDDDVAVAAMLLAGSSHQGIAEALRIERAEVINRTRRIVSRVRPNGPSLAAAATLHARHERLVRKAATPSG
jgi:two-component system, NarL family, response regulator DevR